MEYFRNAYLWHSCLFSKLANFLVIFHFAFSSFLSGWHNIPFGRNLIIHFGIWTEWKLAHTPALHYLLLKGIHKNSAPHNKEWCSTHDVNCKINKNQISKWRMELKFRKKRPPHAHTYNSLTNDIFSIHLNWSTDYWQTRTRHHEGKS